MDRAHGSGKAPLIAASTAGPSMLPGKILRNCAARCAASGLRPAATRAWIRTTSRSSARYPRGHFCACCLAARIASSGLPRPSAARATSRSSRSRVRIADGARGVDARRGSRARGRGTARHLGDIGDRSRCQCGGLGWGLQDWSARSGRDHGERRHRLRRRRVRCALHRHAPYDPTGEERRQPDGHQLPRHGSLRGRRTCARTASPVRARSPRSSRRWAHPREHEGRLDACVHDRLHRGMLGVRVLLSLQERGDLRGQGLDRSLAHDAPPLD